MSLSLPSKSREEIAAGARRIVVKFGTATLMRDDRRLALSRFYAFVESIARLMESGREVLIVSSGAVGLGAERLGVSKPSDSLSLKQACASVGQSRLMSLYSEAFERLGKTVAQVLLIEEDFSNRERYLNLRGTISRLLEMGVLPIINENDTVSTRELEPFKDAGLVKINFGDNDKLSALVASAVEAEVLVLLTDVDGLYESMDGDGSDRRLVRRVEKITPEIEKLIISQNPRKRMKPGRGGMKTKLDAANIATRSGCAVVIANGKQTGIIDEIFEGAEHGTFFTPMPRLSGKKRWIAFATSVRAALVVNEGARKALELHRGGLLPVGLLGVRGEFNRGDVVSVMDEAGSIFARGVAGCTSGEAERLCGVKAEKRRHKPLIHHDNLVLIDIDGGI